MGRTRRRMLDLALEQKRLSDMHSTWRLWQMRLQQQQELCSLEDQALEQKVQRLQRKTLLQWKENHRAACCQKEKEVTAQRAYGLLLVRRCWSKWRNVLDRRLTEETLLQAVNQLAVRSTKRRALQRWKAYVEWCREEAERSQLACQHFQRHLLRAGLRGFSLNITWSKTHRLNNNMAVQHRQQTMMRKYWEQWKEHLEEAEDENYQPLTETAQTNYRISLLSSCFHVWREKLAKQRCMQEMESRADVWFSERVLSEHFKSWVALTQQEQRRHIAEAFDRQRRTTWVIYTWWRQLEKHKEEMLSERMAVLHSKRHHLRNAWVRWRQLARQQMEEVEKQEAGHRLYVHRLLRDTVEQWKSNSCEIRDRRNREQQAYRQGDLCCVRWAVERWKKFVQTQRKKRCRMKEIQSYHEVSLFKRSFDAWKKHRILVTQVDEQADELYSLITRRFLRNVLNTWREKAAVLGEARVAEHRAQNHLQLKVFLTWREATAGAVLTRHQQREALSQTQQTTNQARLLQSFRHWRKQTREARRQRRNMEGAAQHHHSKLVCKTLTAWNKFHQQQRRKKVLKRQGLLLLKLKMYQKYFEMWKIKLQHRRREANQVERALWHWSLTLQAKVLYQWRLWVSEQRSKREQAARAAQVYRDQLLREGVSCILTYAAHMNDLTTSLTQFSQEQRSQRLQRVVKRCAMRWKQRALCKPPKEQQVHPPKKSVTFCLTEPAFGRVLPSDSEEQADGALRQADSTLETQNQDILLPPSAFMTSGTHKTLDQSSSSFPEEDLLIRSYHPTPPVKLHPSACPDPYLRTVRGTSENPRVEGESALTRELLSIQQDMRSFQQSRKQLRAWRKLRDVLRSWLQTSAEDEQPEKHAIGKELKELEERIDRLSTELDRRKPAMLLHAEKIQHLQSLLHTSGVHSLC
uniref:Sfi1 homolog, spindle assembly associated n=2 Tax=Iconisemion striatum TaxID=60296 RepID=A0A1A7W7N7_9TELE